MPHDDDISANGFPSDLLNKLLSRLSRAENIPSQCYHFLRLLHEQFAAGCWRLELQLYDKSYALQWPEKLKIDIGSTADRKWADSFRFGEISLQWKAYSEDSKSGFSDLENNFIRLSLLLLIRHIELSGPALEQRSINLELSRLNLFSDTITELSRQINNSLNFLDDLDQILFSSAAFLNASRGFVCIKFRGRQYVEWFGLNEDEQQALGDLFTVDQNPDDDTLIAKLDEVVDLISHPLNIEDQPVGCIGFVNKERRYGVEPFENLDRRMVTTIVNSLEIALTKLQHIIRQQELIDLNNTILNSVSSGIIATDAQLNILLINNKAHTLLGLNGEIPEGQPLTEYLSAHSPVRKFIDQAVETNQKMAAAALPLSASRPVKVNISYAPMQQSELEISNQKGHVFTFDDVTELNKLKESFSTYVSPEVLEMVQGQSHRLRLGGERRECAVLFCDIRGFTSLSETYDPEMIVETLNQYYNLMIDAVNEFGGNVDKIVGDEIMAVYYHDEDTHACERAGKTGLKMRTSLGLLNDLREEQGEPPVSFGIGINYGEVICGNIGSFDRMDYTVIGDTVNVASRLCSAASSNQILISEAVIPYLSDTIQNRPLDPLTVKGKKEALDVFALHSV